MYRLLGVRSPGMMMLRPLRRHHFYRSVSKKAIGLQTAKSMLDDSVKKPQISDQIQHGSILPGTGTEAKETGAPGEEGVNGKSEAGNTIGTSKSESPEITGAPETAETAKTENTTEASGKPETPGSVNQGEIIASGTAADSLNTGKEETKTETEAVDTESQDPEDQYLTTIFEKMEPYMDTYEVFKQLTNSGFTDAQAEEIISLLIVQLNSKLSKLPTKYSQLYELENERYLYESAQQELRVDVTRSRENHVNEAIMLINGLERDFNVIQDELNNDILQLKNNNQVTINDEKQENTLMSKKIFLKIQETNHKITTELIGLMRSEIESLRWHLSRWGIMSILICIFSGCASFYVYRKQALLQSNRSDEFIPLVIYEPSEFDEDDYHSDLDETVI